MDGSATFRIFILVYTIVQVVAFIAAAIAFAIFFSKEEGKSTGYAAGVTIAAILVTAALSFISGLLFSGLMAFACFYVADRKNRSRFAWAIPGVLFGAPVLLLLLLLPLGPGQPGLQGSLTGIR